jgi:hypothetical protein
MSVNEPTESSALAVPLSSTGPEDTVVVNLRSPEIGFEFLLFQLRQVLQNQQKIVRDLVISGL